MKTLQILKSILSQDEQIKRILINDYRNCSYQRIINDMISEIFLNPSRYATPIRELLFTAGLYNDQFKILRAYDSPQFKYFYIFDSLPEYHILQIFCNTYECSIILVNKFNQKIIIIPFKPTPLSLGDSSYPKNCFWVYYIDGCFLNWSQINYK
tara:strand:+ start:63 stop:524 length:462 start_codon:yes stop_codon:yes gene_type:complete